MPNPTGRNQYSKGGAKSAAKKKPRNARGAANRAAALKSGKIVRASRQPSFASQAAKYDASRKK
jgi:hypothetical protein